MRVLAAANPYRVRDDKDVHTSGLRASRDTDEGSRLVYRVNILPDSVMDIACNYAMLTDDEERLYTLKMVDNALVQQRPSDLSKVPTKWVNTVAATITQVHKYVKDNDRTSPVSLRDVDRCLKLLGFFERSLAKRPDRMKSAYGKIRPGKETTPSRQRRKALTLAISHCYIIRLADRHHRKRVFNILTSKLCWGYEKAEKWLENEQTEYVERMQIPKNVACNHTLKENVFAVLVGVLCRLPVFLTGIPGCSKTLAVRLVTANLRGRDSTDPYFRSLPTARVVTFQGSRQSTSAGVLHVFKKPIDVQKQEWERKHGVPPKGVKANESANENESLEAAGDGSQVDREGVSESKGDAEGSDAASTESKGNGVQDIGTERTADLSDTNSDRFLWIVVLDEVGLAEVSPFKPLKVGQLHLLLDARQHQPSWTNASAPYFATHRCCTVCLSQITSGNGWLLLESVTGCWTTQRYMPSYIHRQRSIE